MNGTSSPTRIPIRQLILVPAVVTLAVTLLRLVGELLSWSPRFFSRAAGGGAAVVGIVWLVPVFGVYFALKLARMGLAPPSRVRAIALAASALLALPAAVAVMRVLDPPIVGRVAIFNVAALLGLVVSYLAWPALGRTLVAYGLSARIPVAAIMLVAIFGNWGTHYELGAPGMPEMGPFTKWVVIGLMPQMAFWMGFTVIVGALFGTVAAAFVHRDRRAA